MAKHASSVNFINLFKDFMSLLNQVPNLIDWAFEGKL